MSIIETSINIPIDTSYYLYAGYLILWLLPTVYLFILSRKQKKIEEKLSKFKEL